MVGGARRDRTADLLHAMQALSQLSYGPTFCFIPAIPGVTILALPNTGPDIHCQVVRREIHPLDEFLFSGSPQLSYGPKKQL